jgi:glycosyltransferase involved in cell wall biosynthesis
MFSVVIPVVARHDKFLFSLLKRLASERQLIGEVIIVRSGLSGSFSHFYRYLFEIFSKVFLRRVKIRVFTSPYNRTAGQNRNLGWEQSRFSYTVFLDADDVYHRFRLHTVSELIILFPSANLILNKYQEQKLDKLYRKLESQEILDSSHILGCDLSPKSLSTNSQIPGGFNISVKDSNGNTLKITQGHIVVRTELRKRVKYFDFLKGEDGLICSEILLRFGEVFVVNRELSQYRTKFSSFGSSNLTKFLLKIRKLLLR